MVTLVKRKNKSLTTLYLDYYIDGKRERHNLKLYLYPNSPDKNKETLRYAEQLRAETQYKLSLGNFGMVSNVVRKTDFFLFIDHFNENYKKADYRMYRAVKGKLEKFLNKTSIPCSAISNLMMRDFNDYLHRTMNGESPFNYFKAMKRILKSATDQGYFTKNPAEGIRNKNTKQNELTKQVLMENEIQILANTYCGNADVKRASLFSTQAGLRGCDIRKLQWKHVFIDLKYIDFGQSKTGRRNTIPLNETAMHLLGQPGQQNEFVFNLPSTTAVQKNIDNWVKAAEIKKHITFHCFRHSCGTNLLINDVDIKKVSAVLGHTSTRHTEKYTRISDAIKHKSVEKLRGIVFEKTGG